VRICLALALGFFLCSCHSVFPFDHRGPEGGPDLPRPADLFAAVDLSSNPPDAAIPDTRQPGDGPPDSTGIDQLIADKGVDQALLPDLGPPDAIGSDLPGPACSALAQPAASVPQWSGKMVVCDALAGTDQCNAGTLCNTAAGWHLCTASEYRALGGTVAGGPTAAWLQACIRDSGGPHAPMDLLCACVAAVDTMEEVAWYCTTGNPMLTTDMLHIGVTTSDSSCRRLGANDPQTEAFWVHRKANSTVHSAVCCY
jgi:hypothetical protein